MKAILYGIMTVFLTNSLFFLSDFCVKRTVYNPVTIEGFIIVFFFFYLFDLFSLFPREFYNIEMVIQYQQILKFLLLFDTFQYWIHRMEHKCTLFYHRYHHFFLKPTIKEAFKGHIADTTLMILCPLYIAMYLCPMNTHSFIITGTIFSNFFLYIHSNYNFKIDEYLPYYGLMNAAYHHKHHQSFNYNFGHLFWFNDYLFGTLHE